MKPLLWPLFVFLVVFPFGQLGRVELTPGITLHLLDLSAGIFVFFWLLFRVTRRRQVRFNPRFLRELMTFLMISGFSLILGSFFVTPAQFLTGFLYWFRFAVYALFYFGVWDLSRDFKVRKKLLDSLVVVGGFTAIFGILQYFLLPDLRVLSLYGWDDHYFRLVGAFLDPSFTGIILVLFLILLFSRKFVSQREQGSGGGRGFYFLIGMMALLLTYSRASFLAFLVALGLFYIVRRSLILTGVIVVSFAIGVFLLPRSAGEGVRLERTSTVISRFENYQEALKIGLSNPIFGIGFNLLSSQQDLCASERTCHSRAGFDSSLLFVFATTGVTGLIAYLWLWFSILKCSWKARFSSSGLALLLSAVALLVHSNFANSLFYPWVLGWFAILLGSQEARMRRLSLFSTGNS